MTYIVQCFLLLIEIEITTPKNDKELKLLIEITIEITKYQGIEIELE